MTLDSLKSGDLLLFEGDQSILDRLIMNLTNSPITHSALYFQPGILADAGPKGIDWHEIADDPKGRPIHARRPQFFQDGTLPPDPVLAAARRYILEGTPFDMTGMFMLIPILLFKRIPLPAALDTLLVELLECATEELDAVLAALLHPGKQPMFCSEFVYQCFLDGAASSGEGAYKIQIAGGVLASATSDSNTGASLARLAADHPRARTFAAPSNTLTAPRSGKRSLEAIAQDLLEGLEKHGLASERRTGLSDELARAVIAFGGRFHRLFPATAKTPSISSDLEFLHQHEAYFVAPCDLYDHTTNVVDLGPLNIDRNDQNWFPPTA